MPKLTPPPSRYHKNYILSNSNIYIPSDTVKRFDVSGWLRDQELPALLHSVPGANRIIKDACIQHRINPRWILATLQKEQSGLTNEMDQETADWAMGFGVPDSGGRKTKYKGFYNQIFGACAAMNSYYDPRHKFYVGPWIRGRLLIDGEEVSPVNVATAACYRYTPHLHGNKLLWTIYARYFASHEQRAQALVRVARMQVGKRYIWGAEVRLDDPNPKAFDCSELVQWAYHQVGLTVSDGANNQWITSSKIAVADAAKIPGALLYRWSNRRNKIGHVGICSGAGTVIEARGRLYGVVERVLTDRVLGTWTHAGWFPALYERHPL